MTTSSRNSDADGEIRSGEPGASRSRERSVDLVEVQNGDGLIWKIAKMSETA